MGTLADWEEINKLGEFGLTQDVISTFIGYVDIELEPLESNDDISADTLKRLGELLTAHMISMTREPQLVRWRHADTSADLYVPNIEDKEGLRSTEFGRMFLRLMRRYVGGFSLLVS